MKTIEKVGLIITLLFSFTVFAGCKGSQVQVEYVANEGGYIAGDSVQYLKKTQNGAEVEARPLEGYLFLSWSDGLKTPQRTDIAAEDMTLTANFVKVGEYTLIYEAGEGGYILGDSVQTLRQEDAGTEVEAIPKEGYLFSSWSDGLETPKRTDKNLTESKNFKAIFSKIEYFQVEYVAGEGGYIVGDRAQTVVKGEDASEVEAVPKAGYVFSSWSDGKKEAARQEENVADDMTFTANFTEIEYYTLNYCAQQGGYIVGETCQKVLRSDMGKEVRALPKDGYYFKGWSDGETSPVRTDGFAGAGEYEALFEKEYFNLPVVEIETKDGAPIPDKVNYVECTVSMNNAGEFDFAPQAAGIRLRGNSTLYYPKKPYRIKFNQKISPFGWHKNKSWVLLALYNDFSDIKDYTAHALAKEIIRGDCFDPNTEFVEVYLNGEFLGLYLFTDQIDEKEGRLNVECDFTAEDTEVPFYVELDEYAQFEGTEGSEWFRIFNADSGVTSYFEVKYPEADERSSPAQFDYIKSYIEKVNALCHDPDVTREEFEEYIDLETFIDYYLLQEYASQIDINYKSIHMSKEKGGKLKMGPVWDFDWSMGGPMDEIWKGTKVDDRWMSESNWFFFMMQKDWFAHLFSARWKEVKGTIKQVLQEVRAMKGEIEKSAHRNAFMWDFDKTGSLEDFSKLFDFVTVTYFEIRSAYIDDLLEKRTGTHTVTACPAVPRRKYE